MLDGARARARRCRDERSLALHQHEPQLPTDVRGYYCSLSCCWYTRASPQYPLAMHLALALITTTGVRSASEFSFTAAIVLSLFALVLLVGWWLSRSGRLRGLSRHV